MRTRHYIMTMCLLVLSLVSTKAQIKNTISIPEVTIRPESEITIPVNIENTTDIVAAQFTLTLPQELKIANNSAKLSNRADGHTIAMKQLKGNKYMFMVYSASNKAFRLRKGTLLTFCLQAGKCNEGDVFGITISEAVLSNEKGDNVATAINSGKVTIAKSPDLEVSQVATTSSKIQPNQTINISWQVANIGGLSTTGGWNERIFLLDASNEFRKLIGKSEYNEILPSSSAVSRNIEIKLPAELGVSDKAKLQVELSPRSDTGEPTWLIDNNTSASDNIINVEKKIYLSPTIVHTEETNKNNIRLYLSRSGSSINDETFSLSSDNDSRLTLPKSITIPQGQSGVYFYGKIEANHQLDNDSVVNYSIRGNGYESVEGKIVIEDDSRPALTIFSKQVEVKEGDNIVLVIEAERPSSSDLHVDLACDFPARFKIPSDIIISKGKQSVEVTIETVDDATPDAEKVVTFTAAAKGYEQGSLLTTLVDNDIPSLQLSLTPNTVSEGAGPLAISAKLKRTNNIDKPVTIKLSDDSNGAISYARQTVEMPAGVEELEINLGPVDNSVVDGERIVNITASVFIASCSCNASVGTSGGIVTTPLTIYDNDGPTLEMSSTTSTLKEGAEITLRVSRNTDTQKSQVVKLSSNHDECINYPSTVTIAAGSSSVDVIVKSLADDKSNDDIIVTMEAECEGYSKGTYWFSISDQTLPDAQIKEIICEANQAKAGKESTVKVTLSNIGFAPLPELSTITYYLSNSNQPIAKAYLETALAPGASTEIRRTIIMPPAVGEYTLIAVVNEDKAIEELLYTNNTSKSISIKVTSPYGFQLSTDKEKYNQEEKVAISGKVSGTDNSEKEIEVYVINGGYRHVIATRCDVQGNYKVSYQPYSGQNGHFVVGACYPGEDSREELASFDVYGMKRVDSKAITCETSLGVKYEGGFDIINPGTLDLSALKAQVVSAPKGCNVRLANSNTLKAGSSTTIHFDISSQTASEGNDWEKIELSITSAEGAQLPVTLYYYCRLATGKLKSSVASINTTMTKGKLRDYPITLYNEGNGETGTIRLSLPNWITTATPQAISSLGKGEYTEVILRLSPSSSMQLNVPVTGEIGINCDNGEGLSLPFYIEPVSEETGTLTIDACDENTYYTKAAPHLAGATVTIKHPTTGEVMAEGETDANGIYSINLAEGYYAVTVTADKHDTYSNNLLVDPGKNNKTIVNLSYEAIKITYDVVETEVEDQYVIETNTTFETNVPVPVIKVTAPKSINGDEMKEGDAIVVNYMLTNEGLINAENVMLYLPKDSKEWAFKSLVNIEPITLSPKNSITYPILIQKLKVNSSAKPKRSSPVETLSSCMANFMQQYEWACGKDMKEDETLYRMALKFCGTSALLGEIGNSILNHFGNSSPGGVETQTTPGKPNNDKKEEEKYRQYDQDIISTTPEVCDPNYTKCMDGVLDALLDALGLGPVNDAATYSAKYAMWKHSNNKDLSAEDIAEESIGLANKLLSYARAIMEPLMEKGKFLTKVNPYIDIALDLIDLAKSCGPYLMDQIEAKATANSNKTDFSVMNCLNIASEQYSAFNNILENIFGNEIWYCSDFDKKMKMLSDFSSIKDFQSSNNENLMQFKPESVTTEQYLQLIERLKGTNENNSIDNNKLSEDIRQIENTNSEAIALGYESFEDLYRQKIQYALDYMHDGSNNVCSSISLQFSQQLAMTRQAFRGTLTVQNGNETASMSNVKLELTIKDEQGNLAMSDKFQVSLESLEGFNGKLCLTDGWTLDAQKTGVANILFIPSQNAAPTIQQRYTFGGVISYVDPATGLEAKRELSPITLTVKPSPSLNLTYFMQRNIIGDDPLTEEIEPSEEAEFSLLINNVGFGDANNVRMLTQKPNIVDNEKGLAIQFNLLSSQFNGQEKALALGGSVATNFGNIPAQSSVYAQWWMTSSLLGHYTSYDVKSTHLTSYDNANLSLLNEVTIHELIRSIDVGEGDKKLKGFLTNDIVDGDDTPDMLYLSNGNVEEVGIAKGKLKRISGNQYELEVTPSTLGWCYGNAIDATYGISSLKQVISKKDGKEISLRNLWQTNWTLRDGKDPIYENKLHFVDYFDSTMPRTYVLTFEPTPELALEVASIEGVPSDGEIAVKPINMLKVMFNKPIDKSTFTSDNISLAIQGKQVDTHPVTLSSDDNKIFILDLSEITENAENGYYNLIIQAKDIRDAEGYYGKNGKSVSWTYYKDGLVKLLTTSQPAEGGNINKVGARGAYNDVLEYGTPFSIEAKPNTGYTFASWSLNGEVISTDAVLKDVAMRDYNFTANFTKSPCQLTIESKTEGGRIEGAYTGIYQHGTEIELTAVASEDYELDSWIVNGKKQESGNILKITVKETMTITAKFSRVIFRQKLDLQEGWNWVSTYLKEPIPANDFLDYSATILRKDKDESILLPTSSYKVNAISKFSLYSKGHLYDAKANTINLVKGWTWIGYPYAGKSLISEAIGNATEGDVIVGQYGFAEFSSSNWEGTLSCLEPNQGYLYKSSEENVLSYALKPIIPSESSTSSDTNTGGINVRQYPCVMSVIAMVKKNGSLVAEDGLRVFALKGDEVRGTGKIINSKYYISIYGNTADEIQFAIDDVNTGERLLIPVKVVFEEDAIGSRAMPYVLDYDEATSIASILSDDVEVKVYTLQGILVRDKANRKTIEKLPKGIYIVNGRKLTVK